MRKIALAQHAQLQLLMEIVDKPPGAWPSAEQGDFQLTLKMLEELKAKAEQTQDALTKAETTKKAEPAPRSSTARPSSRICRSSSRCSRSTDPDRTCPSCGGELHDMKDQFETTDMIDSSKSAIDSSKVKQQKYVCRCGGCVETAIGPERALPGSRYSLAFVIKVLIDKWLDHIPLERQWRILNRHGLVVTSQTLWISRTPSHSASRSSTLPCSST